jgi:drug/metabolite transporter (DMT)-like permease
LRLPTLCGGGAIALWASLAALSRAAGPIPPLQLTAMGFFTSAVLGIVVLAARGQLADLRQPPLVWAHGVGGLAGFHALYFTALALAPAAQANLLNYSWPLLIVLFSAALPGMRLRPMHLVGVALGAAGCALLIGGGPLAPGAWPGYLAAIGSAIIWAGYSVLARLLRAVPTGAVVGFCAASAVLVLLAHLAFEPTVWPSSTGWLAVLALGLGPMGAAFFLWDVGMKQGDPRLLGTLAYATPVASTLLLVATGAAPLSGSLAVAAAMVTCGGVLAARA